MNFNHVNIGEIFNIEKGILQSSKNIPGSYDFITAGAEWKTHNEFSHDCEALIFAMGASGSLGRTHYANGKFIASDLCFILTPKLQYREKVDLKFYYSYFNTIRNEIVKQTATGTSKLAINIKNFSNYKVVFPSIEEQKQASFSLDRIQPKSTLLSEVIEECLSDISNLRQSILQDAVQGKLVPQEPNDEPASVLLKRIKAEKEQMSKEKKANKEKPLPEITENEIPFDLPQGWEWVRLGTVSLLITSGSRDWAKYYSDHGAKFVRMGNLSRDSFELRTNNIQYVSPPADGEGSRTKLETGDILVSITGDVGLLGLIPREFGEAYINQHTAVVRLHDILRGQFYPYALLSSFCKKQFNGPQRGIKNSFRLTDLANLLIPLPPINEQKRIVEKIDRLMALCDELEKTVEQTKHENGMLMQSVIKEAFSQSEKKNNVVKLTLANPNDIEDWEIAARSDGEIDSETKNKIKKRVTELLGKLD